MHIAASPYGVVFVLAVTGARGVRVLTSVFLFSPNESQRSISGHRLGVSLYFDVGVFTVIITALSCRRLGWWQTIGKVREREREDRDRGEGGRGNQLEGSLLEITFVEVLVVRCNRKVYA